MTTKIKRSARVVSDFAKHGMSYLLHRDQISPLEKTRDAEKKWLKKYIDEHGEIDEKGNRNIYFERDGGARFVPGPGRTEYWGIQQRRIPGDEYMDTDEVVKFVNKLLPEEYRGRVLYQETVDVIDTEALYVLQQEGVITAKELRSLIRHHPDKFQLWPITDPPLEDDEDE